LLIFLLGIFAFLVPFAQKLIAKEGQKTVYSMSLKDGYDKEIIETIFLVDKKPPLEFVKKHLGRYRIVSEKATKDGVELIVEERNAGFLVRNLEGKDYLFSLEGDKIWLLMENQDFDYGELPVVFGGSTEEEIQFIISVIAETPVEFRNYISSVDIGGKKIFFRFGSILTLRAWQNIGKMDYALFIRSLERKTVYDLYSNGKFFPVRWER